MHIYVQFQTLKMLIENGMCFQLFIPDCDKYVGCGVHDCPEQERDDPCGAQLVIWLSERE